MHFSFVIHSSLFSCAGMTNNAVEGGTMRGSQWALSPQHRCIRALGSAVVRGWVGGSGREGKGWGEEMKAIRHLIPLSPRASLRTSASPFPLGLVPLAVISSSRSQTGFPPFFVCIGVNHRGPSFVTRSTVTHKVYSPPWLGVNSVELGCIS